MTRLLPSKRGGLVLVCLVLVSSLIIGGCAKPAEEEAAPGVPQVGPPTLVVSPVTATSSPELVVAAYGSGFTPGSKVVVGIPGIAAGGSMLSEVKAGLWLDIPIVNEFGAFTASLPLEARGSCALEVGIYAVVARADDGLTANTPLEITEPERVAPAPGKAGNFSVIVLDRGSDPMSVGGILREEAGVPDPRTLLANLPATVMEGINEAEAKALKEKLEAAGATAEIRED